MQIGVVQFGCILGDVEANCNKILNYIYYAKQSGCEMVVFPEMVDTGYETNTIKQKASSWTNYPYQKIQKAAQAANIYVVCGISEKEDSAIYNTLVIFNPQGDLVAKYRKSHLANYPPLNEHLAITPGNCIIHTDMENMKWGFAICYDLRFPEFFRKLALSNVQIFIICGAWPIQRIQHWNALTTARAIENQAYIIAANRCGIDAGIEFGGSSRIIDPFGVVICSTASNEEAMISANINKENVENIRNKMQVFKHRRPELYLNN